MTTCQPIRVELLDLHKALIGGDYLRVHHSPKRFPAINNHDWGSIQNKDEDEEGGTLQLQQNTSLPGAIVSEDPDAGYIVVNKPPGLPVHPTVDNVLENVAGAIGRSLLRKKSSSILLEYEKRKDNLQTIDSNKSTKRSRKKEKIDPLIYVVTPQRLDQNTSGLFVVATKKSFAAYFAKLLRKKTDKELNADTNVGARNSNIQKKYRCLICIITDSKSSDKSSPVSMWDEVDHLKSIAADNTTVRHYLEPSLKAPRTFTKTQDSNSTRSECLMKIRHVGTPFPVIGSTSSNRLCERLWGCKDAKPKKCVAVVEVEVELLTGRTHQIRGQMSTMGFPLCGDLMYGGSLPLSSTQQTSRQGYSDGYRSSDFLSLQCCELTFRDPIQHEKQNKFRLETSWWSTWLEEYTKSANENVDEATTGALDKSAEIKQLQSMENADSNIDNCDKAINEPLSNIQLCPGKHKYVIIRASKPDQTETEWYVRSSSPAECGGPYHADVAKSLVEKLKKMGYTPVVKGGGRIDFCEEDGHACVYGFSYGFGKGDHQFASLLIEKYSNITALFDDSDLLY